MRQQTFLLFSQTVKHSVSPLVVTEVEYLVNIVIELVVKVLILQSPFHMLHHCGNIIKPDFCEGEVPVAVGVTI